MTYSVSAMGDIFEGNWKELQGKVKKQWSKLSDSDLQHIEGSYDELAGKLKKAYGYNKDEIEEQVNAFLADMGYSNIKAKAQHLKESFIDNAHRISEKVGSAVQQSYDSIHDKSADLQENVVEYIRKNPVKSVGFALVAGIITAKILKK